MKLTRHEFYNGIGITPISHEIDGTTRWGIVYEVVVKLDSDGTFWKGRYEEGATENQDSGYDDDIVFVQVYPHEVLTTVYTTEPNNVNNVNNTKEQ